ncbi:hypothetical protein HDU76_004681 [Blyttiomyces sp. JEL0837]|nr:hypothetical protein HDU76_004681 [Blyttiomyces sp. JEL0837]
MYPFRIQDPNSASDQPPAPAPHYQTLPNSNLSDPLGVLLTKDGSLLIGLYPESKLVQVWDVRNGSSTSGYLSYSMPCRNFPTDSYNVTLGFESIYSNVNGTLYKCPFKQRSTQKEGPVAIGQDSGFKIQSIVGDDSTAPNGGSLFVANASVTYQLVESNVASSTTDVAGTLDIVETIVAPEYTSKDLMLGKTSLTKSWLELSSDITSGSRTLVISLLYSNNTDMVNLYRGFRVSSTSSTSGSPSPAKISTTPFVSFFRKSSKKIFDTIKTQVLHSPNQFYVYYPSSAVQGSKDAETPILYDFSVLNPNQDPLAFTDLNIPAPDSISPGDITYPGDFACINSNNDVEYLVGLSSSNRYLVFIQTAKLASFGKLGDGYTNSFTFYEGVEATDARVAVNGKNGVFVVSGIPGVGIWRFSIKESE